MRAKKFRMKKGGAVSAIMLLLLLAIAMIDGCVQKQKFEPKAEKLNIYCLDVGQGDSTYILFPDGKSMLIDAAEEDSNVYRLLEEYEPVYIDYFVITHPHYDHAGGAKDVIQNYEIGQIFMPDAANTASFFEELLTVIESEEIPVTQAKTGTLIYESDDFKAEIISPREEGYNDLNNMSAVVKITYGNNKFLFMGDAEKAVEEDITSDVSADFIRVGHHGSATSSSKGFLNRVKPKYAVISVGEFNNYNHPHRDIVKRYEKMGTEIYRTDEMGTISVVSNGVDIEIKTQR